MHGKKLLIAAAWCAAAWNVRAAVQPHALFTEGAVLQRGVNLPVWGRAKSGETVTVEFRGQTATAVANPQGDWKVTLNKTEAGGPFTMVIRGENTLTLTNLCVGEVWVCSGQSNMEFAMARLGGWKTGAATGQKDLQKANDPELRLFTVPRQGVPEPRREVTGQWSACTSQSAANFSAVGYYFGRDLRRALQVPVGLISANVGGTPAEKWISRRALAATPGLAELLDPPPAGGGPKKGKKSASGVTTLYNAMIAPLQPFAIKGAIWYQGESNNKNPLQYQTLFPAMIKCWRDEWGQGAFPFLFVQIAPHKAMSPEIREAQLLSWQKTPQTAMVVITDHGAAGNIHPAAKEPVGARLALAACAIAYGEKIEYSGPVFKQLQVGDGRAVLTFEHLGGGLVARGGALKGFTIAGADKHFVAAEAAIEDDTVVVRHAQVPAPVAVRYGWANVPDVNLFNQAGLPATPFRTDVE
ncbi:MAG: sialate O-acetylesterase [Kiritimatiellaeota bacterium]|nr:sialate O-acetylesterase [Kiritimatiellota bacterium]